MVTHLARIVVFSAALGLVSQASAYGLFTVGAEDGCSFHDLQDAIDAATDPEGNTVFVTRSMSYVDQHVQVFGQNIAILGGLDDCSAQDYHGVTEISGTDGHSVFEIEDASSIFMANLYITGASMGPDNKGGGIYFGGQGALELQNVVIGANTAGYGGGIDMSPGTGPATLTLDNDVTLINNTALSSGGGIRIEGSTRLFAVQPNIWITSNNAPNGYGGGLEVVGPARADIGSPGLGGGGVITSNTAQYGGGIDIFNDGDTPAVVRLFSIDPQNPVMLRDNVAYATGGAVWLKPAANASQGGVPSSVLCASDFRIEGNSAQEGAAIYEDSSYDSLDIAHGSTVSINDAYDDICAGPEPPAALGAVPCAANVACNRIDDNVAQTSDGTPTNGSTILMQNAGNFTANRFEARRNHGGHFLRGVGGNDFDFDDSFAAIGDCLVADNVVAEELFAAEGDDEMGLGIDECTIAGNSIGGAAVIRSSGIYTQLLRNIFDQPGTVTIFPVMTDPDQAKYVLSNDTSTLPDTVYVEQGEPTFVDAATGNYHLTPDSLGVDFAPGSTNSAAIDLDGAHRVVDLPRADDFGPLDLGAYEVQIQEVLACATGDTIFCSGFEL